MRTTASKPWHALLLGGFSGALVFLTLRAMADPPGISVRDMHSNIKQYVGTTVTVTGIATWVKTERKIVNGRDVEYTKLNLSEVDQKNRQTRFYVYVSLLSSDFRNTPNVGDSVTITGKVDWPGMFAQITE